MINRCFYVTLKREPRPWTFSISIIIIDVLEALTSVQQTRCEPTIEMYNDLSGSLS